MKTKNTTLAFASILSVLLLVSLVSATITFTNVPTLDKSSGTHTATITIASTESETITFNQPASITEDGRTITFTQPSDITVTANNPETINLQYTVPSGFDFRVGQSYTTTLTADGTNSSQKSQTLSFGASSYCEVGNEGDLEIEIDDISVTGFAEDDEEWYLLDEIEVEVTIDNRGSEDVENIEIEYALYDSNGDLIIDDDVDEGDDETITFTFTLDPDDFDSGEEDYTLYVRATGEIADGVNEGDDTCDSDSVDVQVIMEDDFVILDDIQITPETAQCSSTVRMTADVFNIGQDDQDDVSVLVRNDALDLNEVVEIGDIDTLDSESFSFDFTIPRNADERAYIIEFQVLDEDRDVYENENDDESRFTMTLSVDGGCGAVTVDTITVDATLDSEARAGRDLIIQTIVTNTGDETATLALGASGHNDWTSSASFSQSSVTLAAGESKEVTLTMNVNDDAEGEKTFNIEVFSNGQKIVTQPVSVDIAASGFAFDLGDSWYLWAIGALNIILVIIIIIVAIRVARG